MRFITRTLAFVILILVAFWFTAENAGQRVQMDFAFFRLRASLPLIVFGSVLFGMGASLFVGWRANRKARSRVPSPSRLGGTDPGYDFAEELGIDDPSRHEGAPLR